VRGMTDHCLRERRLRGRLSMSPMDVIPIGRPLWCACPQWPIFAPRPVAVCWLPCVAEELDYSKPSHLAGAGQDNAYTRHLSRLSRFPRVGHRDKTGQCPILSRVSRLSRRFGGKSG
jgi:hypothetical protein